MTQEACRKQEVAGVRGLRTRENAVLLRSNSFACIECGAGLTAGVWVMGGSGILLFCGEVADFCRKCGVSHRISPVFEPAFLSSLRRVLRVCLFRGDVRG